MNIEPKGTVICAFLPSHITVKTDDSNVLKKDLSLFLLDWRLWDYKLYLNV